MKLKRVILDNPIKFHEGRQTQWEQVVPSARYESPKFELAYDPTTQLVSIKLESTTKLVHASRVAQMEPADPVNVARYENVNAHVSEQMLERRAEWQTKRDAAILLGESMALLETPSAKVDKRTKAYRDSLKKQEG